MKQVTDITAYSIHNIAIYSDNILKSFVDRDDLETYLSTIIPYLEFYHELHKVIVSYQDGIEVFLIDQF